MKAMVSDTILRDAVVKELERDPEVVAKHISVTATDGAVALGGHVATIHEKHVAVRAAERVEAVRAVADDIEVRESSLHERADDEIAEEIAHLRAAGGPIPDSVGAQVREAHIILRGDVDSDAQREAAESASKTASTVVPFARGAAGTAKSVGQIPASYQQGSGTIVGGTTASKATKAALAAYPGGIVDRVVRLSDGEYEVHNIGVNWPHHIFVNQNFKVVGTD